VNEYAFASIVQARPCPTFGRPVHRRGSPHRLRPGTSPHALRIPPHGGHPALRRTDFVLRPASRYSRFWIWHPSSERQRDFNPPEQCAAQRTLRPRLTSRSDLHRRPFRHEARSPQVRTHSFTARPPDLRHRNLVTRASRSLARSPCSVPPSIRFLFIGPQLRSALPPHNRSPSCSCASLHSL
jgi:hypothetical protein